MSGVSGTYEIQEGRRARQWRIDGMFERNGCNKVKGTVPIMLRIAKAE